MKTYPPDLRVMVSGYEDGYDDPAPEQLSRVKIVLDVGKHPWDRKHEDSNSLAYDAPDGSNVIDALVLRRTSH